MARFESPTAGTYLMTIVWSGCSPFCTHVTIFNEKETHLVENGVAVDNVIDNATLRDFLGTKLRFLG
jgi:hypothetical protein